MLPIDLHDVAKTYRGQVNALRGVSMQVHTGEVFGLLGPNGAGKSTLVKILMTVISPSACRGTVLGKPVGHKPTLARVGYLPEHHKFPDYLTGAQVLHHYAALAGVGRATRRQRASELLDMVGIATWSDKRVGGYSKGMRQRLGIAQALMNDPDLILLDEPTDGVDPVGRRDIRAILLEQKRRGKTVFLNSHLLSELELVCDRLAIMVQGRVASQGTIDELTTFGRRYEIEALPAAGGEATAPADLLAAVVRVAQLEDSPALPDPSWQPAEPARPVRVGAMPTSNGGSIRVEIDGLFVRLGTDDPRAIQPVLDALRAAGLLIRAARPLRPSLEDLFMRAVIDPTTGRALPPGAAASKGTEARP